MSIVPQASGAVLDAIPDLNFRAYKYALQSFSRHLLPDQRVADCLHKPVPGVSVVPVKVRDDINRARYGNLVVCSRVWQCPVCAYTVSDVKRQRIAAVISSTGYYPVLLTLTVRHFSLTVLRVLLDALLKAYGKVTSGRPYMAFSERFGIVGYVRALEVTWGAFNGWHPHIHVIFLLRVKITPEEHDEFRQWFSDRWLAKLASFGFDADPVIGVTVRSGWLYVEEYLAKWGRLPVEQWSIEREIVSGHYKTARGDERFTPFGLLDAFGFHGDERAGALFVEYAAAFKGRKQLQTSNGFWKLGGGDELPDDEKLLEALEYDELERIFMALELFQWRWLAARDLRAALLDVVQANINQPGAVLDWLYEQGMPEYRE